MNYYNMNHTIIYIFLCIILASLCSPHLTTYRSQQLRNQLSAILTSLPKIICITLLISLLGPFLIPYVEASNVVSPMIPDLLLTGLKELGSTSVDINPTTIDTHFVVEKLFFHEAVQLSYDEYPPKINELAWAKYATSLAGLTAIITNISAKNVIAPILSTASPSSALLMLPILAIILGLRTSRQPFLIVTFVTILAFSILELILPSGKHYLVILFSILINGVTLLWLYAVRSQALALSSPHQIPRAHFLLMSFSKQTLTTRLKKYLPISTNILRYSQQKVTQYGASYVLFGIFCCINFILPYFISSHRALQQHYLVVVLRFIGVAACGLLIVKDKWPTPLQPYLPTFWHITLLYSLPFVSTVMFLLTKGSVEWLGNMAMAITFLILLVDWVSVLLLGSIGVVLGVLYYIQFVGTIHLNLDLRTQYLLLYQGTFTLLAGLIFAHKRQAAFTNKVKSSKLIGGAIGHEVRNAFNVTSAFAQLMEIELVKNPTEPIVNEANQEGYFISTDLYKLLQEMTPELKNVSRKGVQTIDMLIGALRDDTTLGGRTLEACSIKMCTEKALREYHFEEDQREHLKVDLSQDFEAKIVYPYYKHVIFNILKNTYSHAGTNQIDIWLEGRRVHIKDYGQGIAAEELAHIFSLFYTKSKKGTGIGLALCKYILEAFGGHITCKSQQGKGSYTEFILYFPPVEKG